MAIRFAERMTLTLHRPFVLLVATRSCYDPNGKGSHVGHVQYAVKLEVWWRERYQPNDLPP